jgi:PilZ domain
MINAAFAQADTGELLTAVRRDLSETSRELESLRASLDTKLATLEAALASSDPGDSLETLVIDLARTATAEAEAAALRACLEVQLVAQEQVEAIRADAAQSSEIERATTVAVHAHLEDLEATLQAERETAVLLRRELEEQQGVLEGEREAGSALQRSLDEAEQRMSVVQSVRDVEVTGIREQLTNKLDLQRADAEELERVLEKLLGDLGAARDAADQGLAESEAAQSRLAAAEQQTAAAEQQTAAAEQQTAQTELERQAALAAAEAAVRERDELSGHLQAAREDADRQLADFQAAQSGLEAAERQAAQTELERQEALVAAETAIRERDDLSAQLQAAREDSDRRLADFQAAQSRLEGAEQQTAQTELERQEALAGAEAVLQERDALSAQLQAAREDADKRSADLESAQMRVEAAERQTAEAEQVWQEADTRAETAVRERAALAEELDAAREAAGVASEMLARSTTIDAERAEIARVLAETQVDLETTLRDRDAVTAESEAACNAARAAIIEAEARYEDLRDSSERRIRDLELELREARAIADAPTDHNVTLLGDDPSRDDAGAIGTGEASAAEAPGFNSPERQASRHVLTDEVQVQIDGAPAILVDLSANGAQILSPTALKPNRIVKLLLPLDRNPILCKGKIVWARLEPPSPGKPLKYRGGIFFTAVDESGVEAFLAKRGAGPSRRPTLVKTRSKPESDHSENTSAL